VRKNLSIIATIIFALVGQLLWVEFLPIFGYAPDLVLITIIYLSLHYGSLSGEIYGFFSGILVDVFDVSIFGLKALVFTIIGYLCGTFSRQLDGLEIKTQILLGFSASYIVIIFSYLVSSIFVTKLVKEVSLVVYPVVNIVMAPFMFRLYDWWFEKVEKWSGKGKRI